MAKIIMLCGRICCGKTTFAKQYIKKNKAILLSVDEIMLKIFGQHCGDKHDEYVKSVKSYLLNKSLELIDAGIDVVLDCGFWKITERTDVKRFYNERNIDTKLIYFAIKDETWYRFIDIRNEKVNNNESEAYYIDENLLTKFKNIFENPSENEIDEILYL